MILAWETVTFQSTAYFQLGDEIVIKDTYRKTELTYWVIAINHTEVEAVRLYLRRPHGQT